MALDKTQTSFLAKTIIVVLGMILIIGLAGPSLSGLAGCSTTPATTQGGQSMLDTISASYRPVAESWEGALASDPTSAAILVTLGNLYSDWSSEVAQAVQSQGAPQGSESQYTALAISYYQRAIQAGAIQPEVRTDLSISYYYSGDVDSAIMTAEEVIAEYPDFAPAYYNGGIFYETAERQAEALDAFRRYLELDTAGTAGNPEYAQGRIDVLEPMVGGATEITP